MKLLPLSIALVVALAACNKPADTTPATDAAPAATVAPASEATVAEVPAVETGSLDTYVLTMENVDLWMGAQKQLAAAVEADPSLDAAMNLSEETDEQYVARLESTPKVRAAIEKTGMSVRDYAYTSQSLVLTMMAVGAVQAGTLKEMPEGVNPRNVEFIKAHGGEIEAKMKALGG